MSGGIYADHPFSLNIKCVIFTAFIAGGYWFLPHKNKWILLFLLWLPYIALAWYDHMYVCRDKMHPTALPLGRYLFLPFKPRDYQDEYAAMPASQKHTMDKIDHITLWSLLCLAVLVAGWRYSAPKARIL